MALRRVLNAAMGIKRHGHGLKKTGFDNRIFKSISVQEHAETLTYVHYEPESEKSPHRVPDGGAVQNLDCVVSPPSHPP